MALDSPYYETEGHELISVTDGKTKIQERYIYPDVSYRTGSGFDVNFWIKYDKTILHYDYDKKEFIELKYKETPIIAKEILSEFKEIGKNYVIGQDDKIYIVEETSTKITKIDLYNNKEVKDYKDTTKNILKTKTIWEFTPL